jgi:hypothetical protein
VRQCPARTGRWSTGPSGSARLRSDGICISDVRIRPRHKQPEPNNRGAPSEDRSGPRLRLERGYAHDVWVIHPNFRHDRIYLNDATGALDACRANRKIGTTSSTLRLPGVKPIAVLQRAAWFDEEGLHARTGQAIPHAPSRRTYRTAVLTPSPKALQKGERPTVGRVAPAKRQSGWRNESSEFRGAAKPSEPRLSLRRLEAAFAGVGTPTFPAETPCADSRSRT